MQLKRQKTQSVLELIPQLATSQWIKRFINVFLFVIVVIWLQLFTQQLPSIWHSLFGDKTFPLIASNSVVNSTQTKDIAVSENAKLSEKTSLSSSVFGPNCTVNHKNIITKSVVMWNAVIEEGLILLLFKTGYRYI